MMGTYSSLPRLLTPQDSRYTIVDINKAKVPAKACMCSIHYNAHLCKNSTNNVDIPVAVALLMNYCMKNTKVKLPMCMHDWFAILT